MLRRLRALDATKEGDLAAFMAGSRFSLLRVAVGSAVAIVLFFGPLWLVTLVGPAALVAWPGGMLAGCLVLSRTPTGRGALWTFGRGWSPWQQIRNLALFAVLAIGVVLAFWLHGRLARP